VKVVKESGTRPAAVNLAKTVGSSASNTTGDGVLIEFRSVVDAVRCAIEVQNVWSSATLAACRPTAASSFELVSTLGPAFAPQEKAGPPRWSIVVLPFANLGGDPEQKYFVDGVTESLTTDLSRIAGSFVIARNTAFTHKTNSST
jgi:hypothetical protein